MVDEGGLPAVLYEIPARTACSIDVPTVARTFAAGGVAGLKESGGVSRVTALREASAVPILSGDDGFTVPMIALGAIGVVSVASNVAPAEVKRMVDLALAGDAVGAREEHDRLSPLLKALFAETNPIPVKAGLALLGLFPEASVRLPLVEASPSVVAALKALLETPRTAPIHE
jgi:4-hydroxy-tetrahydrodipicolinate synthase